MKRKLKRIALFILFMLFCIWIVWGNITVGITHYQVESSSLPAAFYHCKIAVLSDVHNAEFGKNNETLIALIKQEQPDIIAITGDFIDSRKTNIEQAGSLAENLVKIAPCYFVTGNHEALIGEQYQQLEKKLLDAGVIVLHNRAVTLTKEHFQIQLVGLCDPDFADTDFCVSQSIVKNNLAAMNLTEDYCILLSHRPEAFDAYVSENIDLVLSGHAHGGQIRLPFIGGIAAPNQGFFPKYDAGKYTENHTTMIVSRGIGNSILPVRFNNRPEIVIVEFVSDQ